MKPQSVKTTQRFWKQTAFALTSRKKHRRMRPTARQFESLEQRTVLSANPFLIGIQPNAGQVLSNNDVRDTAPRELVFRFSSDTPIDPSTLNGILVTRAGADGALGTSDDVMVTASREVGLQGRDVVLRFGENLPDDLYRIRILGNGSNRLAAIDGSPFDGDPNTAGIQDFSMQFRLDLGTQVSAVVPQPIVRDVDGTLSQALDQIEVYFNDNELDPALVSDPRFYQLILTNDTATNTDDLVSLPTNVAYDASAAKAVLTFSDNLHTLAGGAGTFRLRIGTAESLPPEPSAPETPPTDPGDSFSTAFSLGALDNVSRTVKGLIENPSNGVFVIPYNFDPIYGTGTNGNLLVNLITEPQKQRVRDVFEIWSTIVGVDVVETATDGITIATGDPSAESNDDDLLIVFDNAVNWNNGFLAPDRVGQPSYFTAAFERITGFPSEPFFRAGDARFFLNDIETILPRDVPLQRGESDIDLYRVDIPGTTKGLFVAEIFAERLAELSTLDAVLRLYREHNGRIDLIAQNDDYFSEDPFIRLELEPGRYYIGVSSTGNDNYDPITTGTGFGGTSEGDYELRLDFRPNLADQLRDASGVAFDGDEDGTPGGTFNFWFRAAAPSQTEVTGAPRIIYVDKVDTTPDNLDDVGTLANPYQTIFSALNLDINGLPKTGSAFDANAARAGDIVRIVGNGDSAGTAVPYLIGVNPFTNQPLADGVKLDVPHDVTVMVDAGAVIKLRRAAITIGSTAVGVDNSKAAFQVLGTADRKVVLTSTNDFTATPAVRGDWGGILFAANLDKSEGRPLYEDAGIFLNRVDHAEIRFGGGIVNLGSIPRAVAPINIVDDRPTVRHNILVTNGVAAISATPDSFEETNFHAPQYQTVAFTSDYSRVGPEIANNRLSNNTINGLFIRIDTFAGGERQRMTVSGRWDDTDIIHVVPEVLEIQGTPGGIDARSATPQARLDARLAIDPGIIVKLGGGRIETGLGAQLIAEGIDGHQITFTSVHDDRFGASGSFDTSNNLQIQLPARGDWGGVYVGHSSTASLDHVLMAYAGGVSAVGGGFSGFNAVEIHQGKARITNSVFVEAASGLAPEGPRYREGRGENVAGVIFIRGAQPVIANNSIYSSGTSSSSISPAIDVNDLVPAITINASALNSAYVSDYGRSTGNLDRMVGSLGNRGPWIRQNRLEDNDINGMVVRGETLNLGSVWDDTDIVHVLFDNIHVENFYPSLSQLVTPAGLRLESSATESLVVKLGGYRATAGFDATGVPLSIRDRIGGSLHIVGQPGRPVVLTSIADDTVGAGMQLDGQALTQTVRPGLTLPADEIAKGRLKINFNMSEEVETNPILVAGLMEAARYWEGRLVDPITINFDVVIEHNEGSRPFASASAESTTVPHDDLIERMRADAAPDELDLLNRLPTADQLRVQFPVGNFELGEGLIVGLPNAKALGFIEGVDFPTVPSTTKIGATRDGQINMVEMYSRGSTVDGFATVMIHEIGHALGFSSAVPEDGFIDGSSFNLTIMDLFRMAPGAGAADFTNNPRMFDPSREHVFYDGGLFDPVGIDINGLTLGDIPLSRGERFGNGSMHPDDAQPSHWRSANATGMNGIVLGIMDPSAGSLVHANDERVFGLLGYDLQPFRVPQSPSAGDWRGIQLDEWTNDRNVEVHVERESKSVNGPGSNAIPDRAEFLGSLARAEFQSDESLRLGFQVNGTIGSPNDVDVYSFSGIAGTEVWLDIDQTSSHLDSVVELINVNGQTLARSDNSLDEDQFSPSGAVSTGPLTSILDEDPFSVNPLDAGMRLVLPGAAGTTGTYFVRVRSSSEDLNNIGNGLTSGAYQLNVRLYEFDEVPGTTIRYADIRYARNGIELSGAALHSPLQTEFTEGSDIASFQTALNLGNPYVSDRGEISVSGILEPITFDPDDGTILRGVDWYRFHASGPTSIDLDFADGIGGPDTHIAIWRVGTSEGEQQGSDNDDDDYTIYDLIYFGDGSSIPGDLDPNLFGGSFGTRDPFIGPIPPGGGAGEERLLPARDELRNVTFGGNYLIAISSDRIRPAELIATFLTPDPVSPNSNAQILIDPISIDLSTANIPFSLNDMTLYVSLPSTSPAGGSALMAINPGNGESLFTSPRTLRDSEDVYTVGSLAMRGDGTLFSLSLGTDDESSGNLLSIDWALRMDDTFTVNPEIVANLADDGIVTFQAGEPDPGNPEPVAAEESDDGIQFQGMTFTSTGILAVGNRGNTSVMGPDYFENIVYQIDGYDFEIDGNQFDPGTALPDEPVREAEPDAEIPMSGAYTDIVELGRFNTGPGGGVVQGIATINQVIYGITSTGRLYRFTPGDFNTEGLTTFIGTVSMGTNFTDLVAGPGGLGLGSILFAIADNGRLFAFDITGAPRNVFPGNVSSIQTDAVGAEGIAFSTLDRNLWQQDTQSAITASPLAMGPVLTFSAPRLPAFDPIASFFTGNESTFEPDGFNLDYNYPGGARGHFTVSVPDLESASVGNQPFLYFNYVLQTENEASNAARNGSYSDDYQYAGSRANTPEDPLRFPRATMRDAFRVYATTAVNPGPDDWSLVATNNSATVYNDNGTLYNDNGRLNASRLTPNEFGTSGFGLVQELFDNSHAHNDDPSASQVRQALVPLAPFVGSADLQLRFEFSTQGTFNEGLAGDEFGSITTPVYRDSEGITDNRRVGDGDLPLLISVGNVFVGTAERGFQFNGEILAETIGDGRTPVLPTFLEYPGYAGTNTSGRYQLSIRPAGDINVFRDQGQLIVQANQISFSEDYGIRISESPQLPTAAANLLAINSNRLVRGPVVVNNLIHESGIGGILVTGDSSGVGAVRNSRIVNNTIVGALGPDRTGVGIDIGPHASPTLMNNILAYHETAIRVHSTSTSTVSSGQLFHGNSANGPLGSFNIVSNPVIDPITGSDGLFVNPEAANFLLASQSVAIDSSVNSVEDRPSIVSVLSSMAINFISPILAPERDVLGQLRIDDPNVESPPGLGSNVIKDRGALERADDFGPRAEMLVPDDNSADDLDPDDFKISTMGITYTFFEVRLSDIDFSGNDLNGVGINDATVTSDNVTLLRNLEPLTLGIDFIFSYDATSDVIRLIPGAGVWVPGVYRIDLNSAAIQDLAGNQLISNNAEGTTRFIVGVDRPADEGGGGDSSWHNSDIPTDVNGDGSTAPNDALIIINEINLRLVSDPVTGALPAIASPPPFYDVNNDGFVAPNDANSVITFINLGPQQAPLSGGTSGSIARAASLINEVGAAAENLSVDLALRSMGSASQTAPERWLRTASAEGEISAVDQIFSQWS